MREDDLSPTDKCKAAVRARNVRTISGFLIVIAGLIFVFVNVDGQRSLERARMGFVVSLIGAGLIEPSHIVSFFVRKRNGNGGKE